MTGDNNNTLSLSNVAVSPKHSSTGRRSKALRKINLKSRDGSSISSADRGHFEVESGRIETSQSATSLSLQQSIQSYQ